jgi:hypothetical protein
MGAATEVTEHRDEGAGVCVAKTKMLLYAFRTQVREIEFIFCLE